MATTRRSEYHPYQRLASHGGCCPLNRDPSNQFPSCVANALALVLYLGPTDLYCLLVRMNQIQLQIISSLLCVVVVFFRTFIFLCF